MPTKLADPVADFGETTVTSKGQITLPSAMRQALDLTAGDRVRFSRDDEGRIVMAPRKRKSILDIAKANPVRLGEAGGDLDKLINEAVTEAMSDKLRRSRGG
jgi:antitoxin PrlF